MRRMSSYLLSLSKKKNNVSVVRLTVSGTIGVDAFHHFQVAAAAATVAAENLVARYNLPAVSEALGTARRTVVLSELYLLILLNDARIACLVRLIPRVVS